MLRLKLPPRDWVLVLGLVVMLYLFNSLLLPRIISGFWSTYVAQPLLWIGLAVYVKRLPWCRGAGRSRLRSILIKLAVGISLFQIYLAVIAGFFDKFGNSPNSFTIRGILFNLIYVGAGLAGLEFSRAWLINRLARKPAALAPFFIAAVYTFFCLPFGQVTNWGGNLENTTMFLGSTVLPTLVENLLASFLAMWGGPLPPMVYRGILQAFIWFCPVLPDLNWAMKALTGTVVPVVGMVAVQQISMAKLYPGKFRKESVQGLTGWIVLGVVSVLLLWFSLGVFPVRPTVIISGSMRPVIEVGDIALVGKINTKLLKNGDIIQFRQKDSPIPVVHRIIEVAQMDNKYIYTTKGDANNLPDSEPVLAEQVVGRVITVVPKVGWAGLTVRNLLK